MTKDNVPRAKIPGWRVPNIGCPAKTAADNHLEASFASIVLV